MNVPMSKGSVCNFTFIIKMIYYAFAKCYPLFWSFLDTSNKVLNGCVWLSNARIKEILR